MNWLNHKNIFQPINDYDSIPNWIKKHRRFSDLSVNTIHISDCNEREYSKGSYRHKSGRYFSIKGISIESNLSHLDGINQPMLDQPEIGILGLIVRQNSEGWEWLLQAKAEPGNVHGVQAAPSVQATKSNYERVHNGLSTPLIECFHDVNSHKGVDLITNIEQSEQGDRFTNKFNRNSLAIVPFDYPVPVNDCWKWFPSGSLREALLSDYMLNTDLRSVLFCSDWKLLVDMNSEPFQRWEGKELFGEKLFYSSLRKIDNLQSLEFILDKIEKARESVILRCSEIPLYELSEWEITDAGVYKASEASTFSIRFYDIQTSNREVSHWCQPLFVSDQVISVTIICTMIDNVLHFFLRLSAEPGFQEYIQLGPSKITSPIHLYPIWIDHAIKDPDAICYVKVHQSDEGGRFMNAKVRYEIIEVPPAWADKSSSEGLWLTLGEIKYLTDIKGYITNETRSALSILLAWA